MAKFWLCLEVVRKSLPHPCHFLNGREKTFPPSWTSSSACSDMYLATGCHAFLKTKHSSPLISFVGQVYLRPLENTWHHFKILFTPRTNITATSLIQVFFQPVGHAGIIDSPRFNDCFVFVPLAFAAVEYLLTVALVFYYRSTFKAIFIPIIVLLAIARPFVCFVTFSSCL